MTNTNNPNPSDETLAAQAATDPAAAQALLLRYKSTVKKITRPYFIMGADQEDLIQEGMIGLHKAIRSYRPDSDATFATFAALCIKTQVLTAIKNASRKKHSPLNSYISIDHSTDQTTDITDNTTNPEKILITREDMASLEYIVATALSPKESAILTHFLAGHTYAQIAAALSTTPKSVDNALYRIRRKVAKLATP